MPLAHAFNGTNTTAVALWPDVEYRLDEVTNVSTSTFADLEDVRRLGHALPVAFATGGITIAGTLVCHRSIDGRGPLWKLRRHQGLVRALPSAAADRAGGARAVDVSALAADAHHLAVSVLPQQLPEFHLLLVSESEGGLVGIERLYGVKFQSSGGAVGVDNPLEEEALQFRCRFYEHLRLHRHLSQDEMRGFLRHLGDPNAEVRAHYWNAGFRTPPLVDGIREVAGLYGADDLTSFIAEEAKRYDLDGATGATTARLLADRGYVLLERENGVYVPEGSVTVGPPEPEGAGPADGTAPDDGVGVSVDRPLAGAEAEAPLSEVVLVPSVGGGVFAEGPYAVSVGVEDGAAYVDGPGGRAALGRFESGSLRARLDGARYWRLVTGADRAWALAPDAASFELTWYEADGVLEATRTYEWDSGHVEALEDRFGDLSGTYAVARPWGTETFTVAHDVGAGTGTLSVDLYGGTHVAPLVTAANGLQGTGTVDALVTAASGAARLVLGNARAPVAEHALEGPEVHRAGGALLTNAPDGDGEYRTYGRITVNGDVHVDLGVLVDGQSSPVEAHAVVAGPRGTRAASAPFDRSAPGGRVFDARAAHIPTPHGTLVVAVEPRYDRPYHRALGALIGVALRVGVAPGRAVRAGGGAAPARTFTNGRDTDLAYDGNALSGTLAGTAVPTAPFDEPFPFAGGPWLALVGHRTFSTGDAYAGAERTPYVRLSVAAPPLTVRSAP